MPSLLLYTEEELLLLLEDDATQELLDDNAELLDVTELLEVSATMLELDCFADELLSMPREEELVPTEELLDDNAELLGFAELLDDFATMLELDCFADEQPTTPKEEELVPTEEMLDNNAELLDFVELLDDFATLELLNVASTELDSAEDFFFLLEDETSLLLFRTLLLDFSLESAEIISATQSPLLQTYAFFSSLT